MCEKSFTISQLKKLWDKWLEDNDVYVDASTIMGIDFTEWIEDKCPYCGRVVSIDNPGVRGKCSACVREVEPE